MTELILNGPDNASLTIVLAHGAGAPMDSPFMEAFAEGLADDGFRVARFEFPYMAERRTTGRKRPPDPRKVLLETWNEMIEELGPETLIVGGKSMGGRMASLVCAEREAAGNPLKGLVCLGYPFHPLGKPEKLRAGHLENLKTPALICQGTRDALGARDEVTGYRLSPAVTLHWLPDGDHGFKPRKTSGHTEDRNRRSAINAVTQFAKQLRPHAPCSF